MPVRNMTQEEKDDYHGSFPPMNVNLQPRVTAEATEDYNCIAWTLGRTDTWVDPCDTLIEWDALYATINFVRADAGTIAVWRQGAEFTHGCIVNVAEGFTWESKCGPDLRILHHLGDLVSADYGDVFTYYRYQAPAPAPEPVAPSSPPIALLSVNEKHKAVKLHDAVKAVPAPVREEFDSLFRAWKKTWFTGAMAYNSKTRARGDTNSYLQLLGMGPVILPLVVIELDNPANFMAVQLYEDLATEPKLRTSLAAMPYNPLSGVQGKARNIVANYIGNR